MAESQIAEHIQGTEDDGQNPNGYPVRVAGIGTDGKVHTILTEPDGTIHVVITGGGGGPVTVADCADVAQGCIADAAITGDNPGTISGKFRGLLKIITDVWDSIGHRLRVDGSGVTQPVSGTVTANQGTNPWIVSGSVSVTTDPQLIKETLRTRRLLEELLIEMKLARGVDL
jgi:hypothetical protein